MIEDPEERFGTTRPIAEVEAGAWSRQALLIVLAVSFLIRVVWLLNVNTMPVNDFSDYYRSAVEISSGQGYLDDSGADTAYRPVGYPAFLAVFFAAIKPTITFAKLLNLLLVMASIGITFRLAHRLFRSNAVAVVGSLLLSFHMNWIAYSGILASEPLYTFLTLWGTWTLLTGRNEKGRWTIGGFAFALATLVRPQALLVPAIVLWCTAVWDGDATQPLRLRRALWACYVMIAMLLTPWFVRNVIVMGAPVLVSTNTGHNLLIGNHAEATGKYEPPGNAGVDFSGMGETQQDSAARGAALDYITAHPWRTVRLWPAKLMATFGGSADGAYWGFQKVAGQENPPGIGDDKPLYKASRRFGLWYQNALMLLFLVSIPALWFARRRIEPSVHFPALGLAMVGYSALLSAVFFGNPRFAFPVIPFIAMYAAALLVVAWQSLVPVKDQSVEDHWGEGR